jgi:nicotinate phosphoribosyltransferase
MNENKTLLTDLYQLTMAQAYLDNNKDQEATFDLFIRKLPKDWGYFIANGIEEAIDYITNIHFDEDDLDYLRETKMFKQEFLEHLKDFKFEGEVYAVKEGTPVFPSQPLLRVTGKRSQAQFLESCLLNIVNFQTMIATKANRVVNAAKDSTVVDFGMRRAQHEDAAMLGARACYLAGCVGTSNVKAGKEYGIPIIGTHAHSFVMSFDSELESFRAYVKTFPKNPTLLIDTYDTLEGARNAAIVANELEKEGKRLNAVRLDSGDLIDLSKKVRQILDEHGAPYVRITASNDLNEYKIEEQKLAGAPINGYGVGTEMITAKPVAAIGGVYKLVHDDAGAKIKLSDDKRTLPGKKQVYRFVGADGKYERDLIVLDDEEVEGKALLELVVKDGKRAREKPLLTETRKYCLEEVAKMPDYVMEIHAKMPYKVDVSQELESLVTKLTMQYGQHHVNPMLDQLAA